MKLGEIVRDGGRWMELARDRVYESSDILNRHFVRIFRIRMHAVCHAYLIVVYLV
jgi:hypothetical protein